MNQLSDLIEQGAYEQALALLTGHNHFSQDELNECLMSACQHKHTLIVQMLVQQGSNVNYQDTNGNTPLLISVQSNAKDIVQFLLTNRANVNTCNSVDDSALILSLRSVSTEITEILLKQKEINIAHQNQDGYTAIMKAAEVKDVDALKILLDEYFNVKTSGCPINERGTQLINEHRTHEHINEHKTHELINEHKTHELISTLRETVNCRGENVHQISERCRIGSVFQLLQDRGITKISPSELAMRNNDIKSFYFFIDSDFLHVTERKKYLDVLFLKMFLACSDLGVAIFKENEIAIMKALLENGVDVNTTWLDHIPLFDTELASECSFKGRSFLFDSMERSYYYKRQPDPIQIAAKSGCLKVVQLLLSHKADVNRYKFPSSPLHIALSHGHTECAKLLIQHGAHIDFNQVLHLAVDQQEPKYVCFLIQYYRNDILKHIEGTSKMEDIFLKSVRMGCLEIIGQILDLGADINGVVGSGMFPLAQSKNGDIAKYLIDRGADVNHIECQRENSDTPLISVLLNRDIIDNSVIEVIHVFLENGASANDRSLNGETAFMLAAVKEGSMSVMQLLLDHGAGLCERDRKGNTALMDAALQGCVKNVSFLIQCSKDRKELLNAQNDEGVTALMCAMISRKQTIIEELIGQGADVHIKDTEGNTCLLYLLTTTTADEGNILKYLIQAGCDVNHQNNHGLSPLMAAASNCFKEMMSVLLKSGAEINAVSKTDNTITALTHLSFRPLLRDYFECLEYLLDRGVNSSYNLATSVVHKMIVVGVLHLVPKLIRCGLGPADVLVSDVLSFNEANNIIPYSIRSFTYLAQVTSHCSPLCISLFSGNNELARFFVENLFLTTSDVYLLGHNKLMRNHLATKNYKECLDILSEITTQPMTLFNLSFVAVSTAVGTTQGRETTVNMLPIPQIIKDKLLFKEQDVVPTEEVLFRIGNPGMPSIYIVRIFNRDSMFRYRY